MPRRRRVPKKTVSSVKWGEDLLIGDHGVGSDKVCLSFGSLVGRTTKVFR